MSVKTTSAGQIKEENGLPITSNEKNIEQNVSDTSLKKSVVYKFLPGYYKISLLSFIIKLNI